MKTYQIPMVPGPVSVSREVLEAGQVNFGSADLERSEEHTSELQSLL